MKQLCNTKKLLQKYLLVLFSLALVFSPFSSLGELAYAEGDANKSEKTEITQKEKGNDDDDSANQTDKSDNKSNESNPGESPVDPSDQEETGNNEADSNNSMTLDEGSEESEKDDPTMKKGVNANPPATTLQNDPPNQTEDGFAWELVEHLDVITITGYEGTDTEITIPSEIAGKEVRYIGGRAFESSDVEKVTIPDTVTSIGVYAFWKSQLKEVDLPNGLTEIQHSVFSHAELTEVTIPNTVTSIGNYAFISNNLSEITLPTSVQTIGNEAFKFNELEELHIPVTVTSVGNGAFKSNDLSEVTIRNPELTLGENVFNGNYTDPAELTIFGYTGSTAETYAQGKGHTFESLNEKVTHVHFLSALAVSH